MEFRRLAINQRDLIYIYIYIYISKAVLVTGREGLWGCEMLMIPLCLDNRLIDGDKVVDPTHRSHFTPQKHYFFNVSSTHFC
jgi:hypothetical protein